MAHRCLWSFSALLLIPGLQGSLALLSGEMCWLTRLQWTAVTFRVTVLFSVFIWIGATTSPWFLSLRGYFIALIGAHVDFTGLPWGLVSLSPRLTDARLSAQVSPARGAVDNGRETDAPALLPHGDKQFFMILSSRCQLHLLPLRLLRPTAVAFMLLKLSLRKCNIIGLLLLSSIKTKHCCPKISVNIYIYIYNFPRIWYSQQRISWYY